MTSIILMPHAPTLSGVKQLSMPEARTLHDIALRMGATFENDQYTLPKTFILVVENKDSDILPIFQKDWINTNLDDFSSVAIMIGPNGGNILKTAALVYLTVASGGLATSLTGYTTGALFTAAKFAIVFGGSFLLNTLFPDPLLSAGSDLNFEQKSPDTVYSVSSRSNTVRPYGLVTEHFGTLITFPERVAPIYTTFAGDSEMTAYVMLCLGTGYFSVTDWEFGGIPVSSFPSVTISQYDPGQVVTSFPSFVYVQQAVDNLELLADNETGGGGFTGPFAVCEPGTTVNKIGLDFIINGLGIIKGNNKVDPFSISVLAEYRPIDDSGVALGPYITLHSEQFLDSTVEILRKTRDIDVSEGRYEVRVKRTSAKSTDLSVKNTLAWFAMKGFLPGQLVSNDKTIVQITAKVGAEFNGDILSQISCVASRKLQIWTKAGGWSALQVTTSPVWPVVYALKKAGLTDLEIDLEEFEYRHNQLTLLGYEFSARITSRFEIHKFASLVLSASKSAFYVDNGIASMIHFEKEPVDFMVFNGSSIVPNSIKLDFGYPDKIPYDSVEIRFLNKTTWLPDSVRVKLQGTPGTRTKQIKRIGAVDKNVVLKLANFELKSQTYGRQVLTFETFHEGILPKFGQVISVSDKLIRSGQTCEVKSFSYDASSDTTTLICDTELTWNATNFIQLRDPKGQPGGLFAVSQGATPATLIVPGALSFTPIVDTNRARTSFQFAESVDELSERVRVLSKTPTDTKKGTVTISGILYYDQQFEEDLADDIVQIPQSDQVSLVVKPVISDLRYTLSGTETRPIINLSWIPDLSATSYLIESSKTPGTWDYVANAFVGARSFNIEPGVVSIRVTPIGTVSGDPLEITVSTDGSSLVIPEDVQNLTLLNETGSSITVSADSSARATTYIVEVEKLNIVNGSQLPNTLVVLETNSFPFTFTPADIASPSPEGRPLLVTVKAKSLAGISAGVSVTVTNPQMPLLSSISISRTISGTLINFTEPPEADFAGVIVNASQTSGFTISSSNQVYLGKANPVFTDLPAEGTWYVRVAAFDVWDKEALTYSAEVQVVVQTTTDLLAKLSGQVSESELTAPLNSRITTIESDISTNQSLVATAQSTADGAVASAQTNLQSLNGVVAESTVRLDANGRIVGTKLINGPDGGDFILHVDNLAVSAPGPEPDIYPFVLSVVGGTASLGLNGALIVDGSIQADSLAVTSLSAISADIGELTSGKIRNETGSIVTDYNATGSQVFQKTPGIKMLANGDVEFLGTVTGDGFIDTSNFAPAALGKSLNSYTSDKNFTSAETVIVTFDITAPPEYALDVMLFINGRYGGIPHDSTGVNQLVTIKFYSGNNSLTYFERYRVGYALEVYSAIGFNFTHNDIVPSGTTRTYKVAAAVNNASANLTGKCSPMKLMARYAKA